MVEKFKEIEIGGRKWRVGLFDARTGSYIIIKLVGMIGPALKAMTAQSKAIPENLEEINFTETALKILPAIQECVMALSESDFAYMQNKALGVCSEVLPGGNTSVLLNNGHFGVSNLEDDTLTVMSLTFHALAFNVSRFLQGSPLSSFLQGLNTSRPDAPT